MFEGIDFNIKTLNALLNISSVAGITYAIRKLKNVSRETGAETENGKKKDGNGKSLRKLVEDVASRLEELEKDREDRAAGRKKTRATDRRKIKP